MALKHHFSGVLVFSRMLPSRIQPLVAILLVVAITAVGVGAIWLDAFGKPDQKEINPLEGNTSQITNSDQEIANRSAIAANIGLEQDESNLDDLSTPPLIQRWQTDKDASNLNFIVSYGGVAVDGVFESFAPTIYFDPENPQQSLFDVAIDISGTVIDSTDMQSAISDKEWFDTAEFPNARYLAKEFVATDDQQFTANGVLFLKGREGAVSFEFTWQNLNDRRVKLVGTALVDRTQFGIGNGSWATDSTIGFDVNIEVELLLDEWTSTDATN